MADDNNGNQRRHQAHSGIFDDLSRGDHRWRLEENGEVEFWATLLEDELFLAIRLSDDRMRQRDSKVAHFPGSLRPSVAAAMAVSLPDINGWITDLNGRVFPFGWAKLAWRVLMKPPAAVRIPLMGVRKEYHGQAIGSVGGSQPHDNFQPYLCVNYIISLFGLYPSPT